MLSRQLERDDRHLARKRSALVGDLCRKDAPLNRISIRGAAVATAMASTSILAATGIAAFASDGAAAADTLRSGHRQAGSPLSIYSVERSALEPAPAVRATSKATVQRRATRSTAREGLAPKVLGRMLAADRGWTGRQWDCLEKLWMRESGWKVRAENPSSGAYGIPQSLPASKMAAFGADYRTSARTQIRWGLHYIDQTYDTPCGAWRFFQNNGYY